MRIIFNFKTFIFILLLFFGIFLLLSTNTSIYIISKIFTTKSKQNEYETIIRNFQQYLEQTVKHNENFLNAVKNIMIKEKSFEERKKNLQRLLELNPSIKYIIFFDKVGFIKEFYPFRKDVLNLYLGNTPMFNNIEKATFSGPYVFLIDKKSYYAQGTNFLDKYIVLFVDIPDFNSYLKELYKKGYYSFIVDENGKIIAHYDESFVNEGANIKMLIFNLYEIAETKEPKEFIMQGEKYLLHTKYLPIFDKYIFIGNDYNSAFAKYDIFKKQLIFIFILFTILALVVSFLVSGFIQKPFLELFRLIENIKKRNYNFTPKTTYFHEFNNLAENISKMGKEILEREEKLSKLFETSRDAIVISSLEGELLDINPFGLKMFGYKDKSEIKNVKELYYYPEERSRFIEELLKKGYVEIYEIKVKRADGSPFNVLLSSSLIKDEKGNPLFLVSFVKDITEKLRMQEQLFQAQKMESIGRLAGSIAHDLNNMLTVISSNNQLIQLYTKDNERVKKYIKGIANAVEKMKDFIKKLLAFSKKQVSDLKIYDINEVIKEEIKLLKPTIREDIKLDVQLSSEPLYVNIDRTHFTQLLLNLVVNAVEAMPGGGNITIGIERKIIETEIANLYPKVSEGDFICISFSDTGMGIPKEIIDKIFDPFFTTKEQGTGLGLSTVYSIVEQHKGFINVYSEVDVGTTFKIYLPLAERKIQNIDIKMEGRDIELKRIVIIEDNDEVRVATEELLSKYGFEVYSFSSPIEFIEHFDEYKNKFDICLSDIIMPKMNGLELYRKLKQLKPDIKFLFMTGYAENIEQVNELIKQGLKVLSKPFGISEFLEKLRELK